MPPTSYIGAFLGAALFVTYGADPARRRLKQWLHRRRR
jgi:hypothetical protein